MGKNVLENLTFTVMVDGIELDGKDSKAIEWLRGWIKSAVEEGMLNSRVRYKFNYRCGADDVNVEWSDGDELKKRIEELEKVVDELNGELYLNSKFS